MSLQTAEAARAASDLRNPHDYTSLTMTKINTAISTEDNCAFVVLNITKGSIIEVVQSDATKIPLDALISAIRAKNYEVAEVIRLATVDLHIRF